ncbi:unnamed protein product [Spirodela intermedia]|uniref:UPF3 domain-containing protein n=1 Tax=Spirodela intermedia TaxID=51605 RepID=A0A7I8KHF5_SPIIN|nr:unnamed protein product [Spirodela intermedia]
MKDPFERTKVVLRRLPPAISQSALMEQIDGKFAGRYKWFCFRPGKNSQKNQRLSRAYIDFEKPEDVVEFAEFFDGHLFVNEKGTQFKALVEYAPSQRVPKLSKKDGREGTIFKDPEYAAFLEHLSKPVENLPSAEIQLERREAERAGAAKDMLIVTPLMEFVRQKRASKSSSQKSSANGKASRRSGGTSSASPLSSKRASEKKKHSTPVGFYHDFGYAQLPQVNLYSALSMFYVLRDSTKGGKDRSRTILVPRRDEATSREALDEETDPLWIYIIQHSHAKAFGAPLLECMLDASPGGPQQQAVTSPARSSSASTTFRHNQRHGGSGKIVKSIVSKEARQVQSPSAVNNSDQHSQLPNLEKDKRPPRPPNSRLHASDDSLSSSSSLTANALSESLDGMPISSQVAAVSKSFDDDSGNQSSHIGVGTGSSNMHELSSSHMEMKSEIPVASRSGEGRGLGSGRGRHSVTENSSQKHIGRRGQSHGLRETDGSLGYPEPKTSKRGPVGYGSHEVCYVYGYRSRVLVRNFCEVLIMELCSGGYDSPRASLEEGEGCGASDHGTLHYIPSSKVVRRTG